MSKKWGTQFPTFSIQLLEKYVPPQFCLPLSVGKQILGCGCGCGVCGCGRGCGCRCGVMMLGDAMAPFQLSFSSPLQFPSLFLVPHFVFRNYRFQIRNYRIRNNPPEPNILFQALKIKCLHSNFVLRGHSKNTC